MEYWENTWGAEFPADLEYPFLIDSDRGVLVSSNGDIISPVYPNTTVLDVAQAAVSLGATPIRKWTSQWGMAAGFSLYGTVTAWFAGDDYEFGRFFSLGIRIIDGIAFGDKVSIYFGDIDQAARYALTYGVSRGVQEQIESVVERKLPFPVTVKTRKLWGSVDAFANHSVDEALRELQKWHGIDPITTVSASKTVEIASELVTT